MTIYLWHLPVIIALSGTALLIPGTRPQPASAAWWASRPVFFVAVMVALFGLSFLLMQYYLDVTLAITGSVLLSAAILLLGRWPSGVGDRSGSEVRIR